MTNKALLIANWSFDRRADIEEPFWWPPLKGPKNDIKLMVKTLTDEPFGIFVRDNITCCENYAKGDLETAILEFFKKTEPDDYVLVYFTGHGFPFAGSLRLVTRDTHKNNEMTGMPIATLDDCIKAKNRAEQYVLILDCCYAGAAANTGDKGGGDVATLDAEVLPGRWALYSSDQYTTSRDAMKEDEPSPFTKALCDALINPGLAAREDGVLTLATVKDAMAVNLGRLAGNPKPQLNILSNGLDPGIGKREDVRANLSAQIAELSHLGEADDILPWPVEVEQTQVEVLSHLSALHDLAATFQHLSDSRARTRRSHDDGRTAEESHYLGRALGQAMLRAEQITDLQEHLLDPTRLARVQLSFPPGGANGVDLLPWEHLTYALEADGEQAAIATLDGLTVERLGPRSPYLAPDHTADKITEVALIGGQNGASIQSAETALRRDLAALGILVSPSEVGSRYDSAQPVNHLPSVVVVLAGLSGAHGSSGRELMVQFGPAQGWCPIAELGEFLRPRRKTEVGVVAPYRAIIVETYALDPERDSARATIRLASYLAGLKYGNVAFIGHPPGSSGILDEAIASEPKTFVGQVVRALNLGYPLHRAVYAAKVRVRKAAGGEGGWKRSFGVPGTYQLTFADPPDRSPRRGEALSRPHDQTRGIPDESQSGPAPVVGDEFIAAAPPATSINVPPSGAEKHDLPAPSIDLTQSGPATNNADG